MVANTYADLPDIIRKITDSETDQNLSMRCRQYVEKHHNPEILANKLIEFIK